MTTSFRLNSITLQTTQGTVEHRFSGALTVLAGSVGVGKSTLFELVKYGLGGDGLLAEVVTKSVLSVSLDISINSNNYLLTRTITPTHADARVVKVVDLVEQFNLPDHFTGSDEPSLSSLLLAAMDLPDDLRAATTQSGSTNPGTRISFYDVFKYMYVSQGNINEQIAGSGDSWYQPKRKAVFELLFGLTNPTILDLQSEVARTRGQYEQAQHDYLVVRQFLEDSNTQNRIEAEVRQHEALQEKQNAEQILARIQTSISPTLDHETKTLRELLAESERNTADARNNLTILIQQKQDFIRERALLQQDIARTKRMIDAGERLAKFEFAVCPRCMQDVRSRPIPDHACRLCLQQDPVEAQGGTQRPEDNHELLHLEDQIQEFDTQIFSMEVEIANLFEVVSSRESLIADLSAQIELRTSNRITPQLQAFADATSKRAQSDLIIREIEKTLVQWDRADDLELKAVSLQDRLASLQDDLSAAQNLLDSRRIEILDELDDEFHQTASAIGIPGVHQASINRKTYLPMLNGIAFQKFSPVGGVRTATQVAYWVSLMNVALRRRDTSYPAFLLLDSPRTSLNDSDDLSSALYQRLITMADAAQSRVQILIGDNELPAHYRKDYMQLDFDYDHPTIYTLHHPGREAVTLLNAAPPDDAGTSPSD
ncbi:hypothetical protein CH306_25995 [Rhodococcus sp. 15-725-2-2b]|uniref:hypothetical protein n=1 Tax=unclassified Rhodococcus (in: high G+C Gram-positive bacteria) TaxID=192944 RepID=UPI000B9BA020|nr:MULTISPECIES: hypothetical protein [unclassified Rhodococcus (in: high G+C Gram-positive bacteria)]OZC63646.1 hypothetical protein CH277_22665 [Rhodococcus sp. 06-469-3-2]OZD40811.1 hypothetical protein CH264_24350 [Rhodococcus sp. 06-1477-1A]OZE67081.1 hypothetical protein CH306_25995 [Rhodococcus sp. 15-725-2-2b]